MSVSFRLDRSVPVLSVEGRLDARGAAAFDQAWKALPPETSHVVLDLTAVDYLSSVGIGSLVTAEKCLRERHGRTILAGLSPFVARILETTGLLREFQHVSNVPAAVEQALIAKAARDASTEHTIEGRLYRISPNSTEPCVLELWGDYQQTPDTPRSVFSILEDQSPRTPIGASLEEVGFAFGEGGFGNASSHSQDCIGALVAAGKFAGVLAAGGNSISDFVISGRPDELELVITRAIGLSGPSSFEIDVTAPVPTPLRALLADSAALLAGKTGSAPPVIGFVMRATAAQGMLLVGVFSPDLEKLYGNSVLYEATPTLTPKIQDLKGVRQIDAHTTLRTASISLYLPRALQLGIEKRLKIHVEDEVALQEEWIQIIRRLYRDYSRVSLTQLTGGYMAKIFRVTAYDRDGRRLLPTVLKISTNELIQREEAAHRDYVQKFILNNSTTIMGTAAAGSWAALRYNFLGISGPDTTLIWLRDYYRSRPTEAVLRVFDRLYTQILKPWYGQPRWEPIPLYADHTPLRLFPHLCEHAERDFGFSPEQESIYCAELGISLTNPFLFLRTEYPKRSAHSQLWYQAINHGDLNLRNVLVDEKENVYVIDFSETRPRNIVSDFARMETILKFEMTRVDTVEDLARMIEFEQGLAEASSLADTPPNRYRGDDPLIEKAYSVICRLRRYANTVTLFETDIVPYWLALLEWTFSVLSYDLPPLRRKLAAYSVAIICGRIRAQAGS